MRSFGRYALSVGAVASLAACARPPIGMPGATPQSRVQTPSSYRVVYRFVNHPDGKEPLSGLLDVGNTLYGTASGGGSTVCNHRSSGGCGTVYGISRNGAQKFLFEFTRAYGTNPQASLTDVKGTLYGTTVTGGWSQRGTVYSISPTGTVTMLHTFRGRPGASKDGQDPSRGHVVYLDGVVYGTTYLGGSSNDGTFYSISTAGSEKVLYNFAGGSDGAIPQGLIKVKGTLYGTTSGGGGSGCGSSTGCGTVYTITTAGTEQVLYRFKGGATDGAYPVADLLDVNGTLYGTTSDGGASGDGTVYSLTASGTEKVLYSFAGGSDGAHPLSPLIYVNGMLYGTTSEGGGTGCKDSVGCGTVYGISPSGTESVLYSFSGGDDGSSPKAPLLEVGGTLYGTTVDGGASTKTTCCGTVFSLRP